MSYEQDLLENIRADINSARSAYFEAMEDAWLLGAAQEKGSPLTDKERAGVLWANAILLREYLRERGARAQRELAEFWREMSERNVDLDGWDF